MKPRNSLAGRWHLVAATADEDQVPHHRVDFVFHDEPTGPRGAILSRNDGGEVPLQRVIFSGTELRLQMSPRPGASGSDLPFLVMTAVEDRFEGAWATPGAEGPRLKLIRARESSGRLRHG